MVQHEGLFPSPSLPLTPPAPREPRAATKLIARLRSFSLDERIAAGEDPSRSRLLEAQAARLTAPRHRERLVAALNGLLLAAEQGRRISRISPSRSAVLANEAAIRELARRVDSQGLLYARGLARLERLLSDSTGAVFHGGARELAAELERVEAELSGGPSGEPAPRRRSASGSSRGRSVRALARLRASHGAVSPPDAPGFARGSFALPDGSWFHGRRESS